MNGAVMSWSEISLSTLCENYRTVCRLAQEKCVICVVKADAYGHGAIPCAQALFSAGCRFFAVANFYEASALRAALPDCRILILGATPPSHAPILVKERLSQCVFSRSYALALQGALERSVETSKERLSVHMKLNSGMNRLGFLCEQEALDDLVQASQLPALICEGLFSHLCAGEDPQAEITKKQVQRFHFALSYCQEKGLCPPYLHLHNSPALAEGVQCDFTTAVRTGLLLYGYGGKEVRPVLRWHSRLIEVFSVQAGEGLGYAPAFSVPIACKVGVVSCGYADGFLRAYRGAQVLVGKEWGTVASVCMDLLLVVLPLTAQVAVGDTVTLLSPTLCANRLAKQAGTIPYEVLTSIGKRVRRRYF